VGLTSGSIPNFINGVSQQAPTLRLASQAEEQVNGFSTLVDGLKKRPPSRHLAKLLNSPASNLFAHVINRDANERYVVIAWDDNLKVFDLDGVEKTVAFPDGASYLNCTAPSTNFGALTIADYTFWRNKDVVVAMGTGKSPARPFEALINVRAGNYGKTYKVLINGSLAASYTAPNGGVATDAPFIDTSQLAAQMYSGLTASGFAAAPWSLSLYNNVVYLANSTTDFTIAVEDGFGGTAMTVAKGTIQHFSDLPTRGPAGFVVEIGGDKGTTFDNYFVELKADGTWKETVKPDTFWDLSAATLPHVLVRESTGDFTFKRATWDQRLAGDEDSNPEPSFIGRTISDIFFHRNRLGLASDENVLFSASGSFFNVWRKSVTAVLDDDPIDVGMSHTKVSVIRHAVPFRDALILFSDQTQFSLKAQNLLTAKTVAITPTTELPCSQYARPVAVSDAVFFASDGDAVRVYEYKLDPDAQALVGEEITGHVPHYLPTGTGKVNATAKHNFLAYLGSTAVSRLYCYQWLVQGRDKLQAAWHYWDFGTGAKVLAYEFLDSDLLLVIERDGAVWLEKVSVDPAFKDDGLDYWLCLDRRVHSDNLAAPTYDAANDWTVYVLPYTAPADIKAVLASASAEGQAAGMSHDIDHRSGTSVFIKGDVRLTHKFYFGVPYTFRYKLSPILAKRATRTGEVIISDARLQLRYLSLVLGPNTAEVITKVTPQGRPTVEHVLGGYVLGSDLTDAPPTHPKGATQRIPIFTRSDTCDIEFVSTSHLPCAILSADWEGILHLKARPGG
jgi:hypothetical protein